jgi:predicted secreted hydrolase
VSRSGGRKRAAIALGAAGLAFAAMVVYAAATTYGEVDAVRPLLFPQDHGSHPQFRTEWWYVTGWLKTAAGEPLGFQVTFFRTRPAVDEDNPSAFTPRQLIIAHAALSDPARGRLWQDQRIERAGFGLAEALVGETSVWVDRWSLKHAESVYAAQVTADDFSLTLQLTETQAPMPNGESGLSRKGPDARSASYYYSIPHLAVAGTITRQLKRDAVSGEAWLDHEWSSEYLDSGAVGWDWIGINLDDGGALMAFRIRGARGESRWSGGTLRAPDGHLQILDAGTLRFAPGRTWISPRTAIRYPVEWRISAGSRQFDLEPLLDDQENDTRLSTGAIYWEGAVRAREAGRPVGRGYLELTGYGEPLRLR